jgi:hypothetical protein
MHSLQIEEPKAVKGLSSMQFIVKRWREIAISESKEALEEYAKTAGCDKLFIVWRIVER